MHIKGISATNLKIFRTFYQNYPQIQQTLSVEFKTQNQISQTVSDEFKNTLLAIQQTLSVESISMLINKLLRACSFSHFIEFLKIDNPLKRTFYEIENINNIHLKDHINRLGQVFIQQSKISLSFRYFLRVKQQ